jgi:hypothetical protein
MSVSPEMIRVALGRTDPPSDIELQQWQMWIDDALMLILARQEALELGDIDDLDEAKLDYVIREAVAAHVRQPDTATQVTVSVQDASTSRMYSRSTGRITFRDEWWTLLGLTLASGGIYGIDTAWNTGVHAAICSLNFGALYCSCGADLTNYAYPLFEHENSIGLVENW